MILYLDTSSLVKLYVEEAHSSQIRQLVDGAQVIASSRIAYLEARAAFARKHREHGLTTAQYRSTVRELDQDWGNYFVVDVHEPLVKLAGLFTEKHSLRAFDAIHLASAVTLHKQSNRDIAFSCFDTKLLAAAKVEGLTGC